MRGRLRILLALFPLTRLLILIALGIVSVQASGAEPVSNTVTIYDIKVVESRPYDRGIFTQGFVIESKKLWVSSGLYGQSFIERRDWPSGENRARLELPDKVFAEGLAMHKNDLFLLTWKSQTMLVIDPKRLEITDSHSLPGEGWGLTSNGESLWLSDGTSRIREWRNGTFRQTLLVTLRDKPMPRLNELEWINGEIWANVWLTDQIVTIEPTSGRVTRIIDLTNLLPRSLRARDTDVLNGIAQDPETGGIWVTGKRWPSMYRIELVKRHSDKH